MRHPPSTAPAEYVSRVQAVFTLVQSVTLVASNALIGSIAHAFGPRETLLVCVGMTAASALVGFSSGTVRSIQRQ